MGENLGALANFVSEDYVILGRNLGKSEPIVLEKFYSNSIASVKGTNLYSTASVQTRGYTNGVQRVYRVHIDDLDDYTLYMISDKGGRAAISQSKNIKQIEGTQKPNFLGLTEKSGGRLLSYYGFELKYLLNVALQVGEKLAIKETPHSYRERVAFIEELESRAKSEGSSDEAKASYVQALGEKVPPLLFYLNKAPLGKWLSHWGLLDMELFSDYIERLIKNPSDRYYYINSSMVINSYKTLNPISARYLLSDDQMVLPEIVGEKNSPTKFPKVSKLGIAEKSFKIFDLFIVYLNTQVIDEKLRVQFLFSALKGGKEVNKGYILQYEAFDGSCKWVIADSLKGSSGIDLKLDSSVSSSAADERGFKKYRDLTKVVLQAIEVDGRYLVIVDDARDVHKLIYLWFSGRGQLEETYSLISSCNGDTQDQVEKEYSKRSVGEYCKELEQVFVNPGQLKFFQ